MVCWRVFSRRGFSVSDPPLPRPPALLTRARLSPLSAQVPGARGGGVHGGVSSHALRHQFCHPGCVGVARSAECAPRCGHVFLFPRTPGTSTQLLLDTVRGRQEPATGGGFPCALGQCPRRRRRPPRQDLAGSGMTRSHMSVCLWPCVTPPHGDLRSHRSHHTGLPGVPHPCPGRSHLSPSFFPAPIPHPKPLVVPTPRALSF